MRDRRWDFLYDRERQPVKAWVLDKFAEELTAELLAWPPAEIDWVSEELRARWAAGAAERPRDDVFRFALELGRLDLLRAFDEFDRRLGADAHRLQSPAEAAALHLLVRLVTERCLDLKERADRIRLTREDLADALGSVERRMFRITLS